MGSKSNELACLNLAISECFKQQGASKKIGLLLAGDDIKRDDNERPDFLRCYKSSRKTEKDIVIGIEHFRVDHYVKELSNQRVGSSAIVYEKSIKKTSDNWKSQIYESEEIPEGALHDIGNLISQSLELSMQATYNAFIESFKYSLDKHNRSIDHYHSIINNYAGDKEKKFAFLIEIHSDFNKLLFHDKTGIHYGKNVIPLFDELIKILEEVDTQKVDYFILCFGNTIYNENTKVIAVSTANLRKQFKRQHIPIYFYAGHDIHLSKFQTPRLDFESTSEYKKDGDNIVFHVTTKSKDIKENEKLKMVISAYKYIKLIESQKKNFATTALVEKFYQEYNEFLAPFSNMEIEDLTNSLPIIVTKNKDLKTKRFEKVWDTDEKQT